MNHLFNPLLRSYAIVATMGQAPRVVFSGKGDAGEPLGTRQDKDHIQKAMKALGYSIALDIDNQSLWSDGAIATAWYEAAGRDYDEFERMIRADELWMRREGHREISIIFSLVFAM